MGLYNAYLKSLELALCRDIRSDTFVIRKTVSYLSKAISDIYSGDPKVLEEIARRLDEYLDSTIHLEVQLETLFGEGDPLDNRIYEINIAKLNELKSKVDYLLSTER